jgi:hypothetical protein
LRRRGRVPSDPINTHVAELEPVALIMAAALVAKGHGLDPLIRGKKTLRDQRSAPLPPCEVLALIELVILEGLANVLRDVLSDLEHRTTGAAVGVFERAAGGACNAAPNGPDHVIGLNPDPILAERKGKATTREVKVKGAALLLLKDAHVREAGHQSAKATDELLPIPENASAILNILPIGKGAHNVKPKGLATAPNTTDGTLSRGTP